MAKNWTIHQRHSSKFESSPGFLKVSMKRWTVQCLLYWNWPLVKLLLNSSDGNSQDWTVHNKLGTDRWMVPPVNEDSSSAASAGVLTIFFRFSERLTCFNQRYNTVLTTNLYTLVLRLKRGQAKSIFVAFHNHKSMCISYSEGFETFWLATVLTAQFILTVWLFLKIGLGDSIWGNSAAMWWYLFAFRICYSKKEES